MTEEFFVYEGWTRDRSHVHKAGCKVLSLNRTNRSNDYGPKDALLPS
jgi:hypothetical protein